MAAVRGQIQQGLKLSKSERKILRKQNKALHTLRNKAQEVGEISQFPTAYLLVKNGGLMCGVKRQDLFEMFHKYGTLEDVVMLPGKSYSYAIFSTVESAQKAMVGLNGQKILSESYETSFCGKILYLAYLVNKPCVQLCSLDRSHPAGMILVEDFISESEESDLLQCFSNYIKERKDITESESEVSVEKQLKHRYVKHYGYEFLYGSNTVDKEKPLPDGMPHECLPIIEKIMSLECVKHRPDQLTINEYLPGQGIPPHIDTHSAFEDGIISLSLGAKVAMDFRHPDGRHDSVLLPRRSILVMTEESRYVWTHGITPRKYDVISEDEFVRNDSESIAEPSCVACEPMVSKSSSAVTLLPRKNRLSLTFRKVRSTPCDCKYPVYCDSQTHSEKLQCKTDDVRDLPDRCSTVPQSEQDAIDLEKKHVYYVYDNIAEHFSGTRHSPWPRIAAFLKAQPPGSFVADVGCGNGKYLGINEHLFMSGSDRSLNLARICRERGFQVIVCDILSLPYRSNAFDVCICIAVIHHLSTPARRLAALKELTRIVRPHGRILISVWALEQNLKNVKPTTESHHYSDVSCQPSDTPSLVDSPTLATADAQSDSKFHNTKRASSSDVTTSTLDNAVDSSKVSLVKLKVNESRHVFEQQDLLVPWHYRGGKKKSMCDNNDESLCCSGPRLVESKQGEVQRERVFQRFYHVFKENELVDDCRKLNNISIVQSYYDKGNWCIVLEKVGNNE